MMKGKFWRLVIGGLCLNLVLMLVIYFFARLTASSKTKIAPVTRLSDITYTQVKNGVKAWELRAKEARILKNEKVFLRDIKVVFFSKDGSPVYVNAETGWLNLKTKNMELTKNVKIWQKNGFVFLSDYLKYNHKKSIFLTKTPVTVEGKGIQLVAKGMKYFVNEKKWLFTSEVKTWFRGQFRG